VLHSAGVRLLHSQKSAKIPFRWQLWTRENEGASHFKKSIGFDGFDICIPPGNQGFSPCCGDDFLNMISSRCSSLFQDTVEVERETVVREIKTEIRQTYRHTSTSAMRWHARPACRGGGTLASETTIHNDQQSSSTSPSPSQPSAVPPPESAVPSHSARIGRGVRGESMFFFFPLWARIPRNWQLRTCFLYNNITVICAEAQNGLVGSLRAHSQPSRRDSIEYGQVHV
jgi:hypothetical protein